MVNTFYMHFPVWRKVPSTNFVTWFQSRRNKYPGAAILVSRTERSYTGSNLVNGVSDGFSHANTSMRPNSIHYTGLQGFVVEKLWVVSGVIFDVESESEIRISLSRQDIEICEVMCSKNGGFRYF